MRELRTAGSVRGVPSNGHPYCDSHQYPSCLACSGKWRARAGWCTTVRWSSPGCRCQVGGGDGGFLACRWPQASHRRNPRLVSMMMLMSNVLFDLDLPT